MNAAWPKVVPILEPSEINQGSAFAKYSSGRRNYSKKCILAWCWTVFPARKYPEASARLGRVLDQEFRKLKTDLNSVPFWNDWPGTKKEEICALWLKVMRRLGYTVPCKRK